MNLHDLNEPADRAELRERRYWQRSRRLSGGLLLVWALVSFGLSYFARELDFSFFGWPFSFWVASQGALLVFCAIVAYYSYAMRKLDESYRNASS
jgi:putative solute:sodium symporter small subunit